MKIVTIRPVNEPKSYSGVNFTQDEWKAAAKSGAKRVPFPTAVEAVRNSKGLYQIAPDRDPVEVEVKGLKDPDEMSKEELVQEMTMWGKPPRKQMARQTVVEFIRKLRSEAADLISDDEET